ncbi:YegP family protein [Pinirhizobacter soli]|uniref:YegP family protein n=1 Tax=Pinirhizobacter soli TaxID=2786953 RepID=UPI002029B8DD|nr:YegP family protein [Pinirhizobacter soli]
MAGYYDLKKSGSQFMFNLKAGNGEVILTSERYETKGGANSGISSVQTNCTNDSRYEKMTSKAKQPYFVLKAANGQDIGTSEMYSSTAARDNGIQSVKTNGTTADIRDNT